MTQRTFQLSAERRQLLEKMLRARGVDAKLPARIEPRTEAGPVPLSFAQQRLWFLHQLEPNAAHYHIVRVVRLGGRLDIAALAAALGGVVQRHEALRTVFRSGDGEPQQVTLPPNVALPLIDLSGVSPAAREATAHRLAGDSIGQPFDLSHGPLLRVVLLRLGPTDHIAALAMHHIVSDEWSMGIFIRELATLYEAAGAGQPPNATALPPLEIQYPDFAIWQRRWLRGEVFADRLAYWRQQLAGAPEILELPTDRPRPRVASFRGARRSIAFDAPLAAAIEALGRRHGATQFITLTAAFKALLAQYCQRSDIVIGAVIANRDRAELEPLIGFFVNTLVLRTHLGGDPTFVELIARQRQVAEGAYAHQELPFEKLVDELKPERDPGYNPLFQVAFVFQNAATTQHQLPGLTIRPVAGEAGVARFDLTLVMGPAEDGLTCWMDYRTDLFDATTIARMLVGLRSLLASVAADENLRLSQSPLLGRVERHQLIREWGSCPAASLS
ncbi:MAG: condensation domain-containing protein, partial [Acidobacteriota bacterium]